MNEGTYIVSLDGKFRKLLKSGGTCVYLRHPRTGKSYLLSCEVTCVAQQFDTSAVQLIGDPVIVPQVPAFAFPLAAPAGLVYHARRRRPEANSPGTAVLVKSSTSFRRGTQSTVTNSRQITGRSPGNC